MNRQIGLCIRTSLFLNKFVFELKYLQYTLSIYAEFVASGCIILWATNASAALSCWNFTFSPIRHLFPSPSSLSSCWRPKDMFLSIPLPHKIIDLRFPIIFVVVLREKNSKENYCLTKYGHLYVHMHLVTEMPYTIRGHQPRIEIYVPD